ncbi:MAG: hypothetical protein ACOZAN_04365 [Patescibacteria group bacterium]
MSAKERLSGSGSQQFEQFFQEQPNTRLAHHLLRNLMDFLGVDYPFFDGQWINIASAIEQLYSTKEGVYFSRNLHKSWLDKWPGNKSHILHDHGIFGPFSSATNILVVKDPTEYHDLIKPDGTLLYSVTNSNVFADPNSKVGLIPSSSLAQLHAYSHFGLSVERLRQRILNTIMGEGSVKSVVWMGPSVSGRLAMGTDQQMRRCSVAEMEISFWNWLFDESNQQKPWVDLFVNLNDDELKQLDLSSHPIVGPELSRILEFIFMSDGWQERIKKLIGPALTDDPEQFQDRKNLQTVLSEINIYSLSDYHRFPGKGCPPGAVIVEIDAGELFRSTYGIASAVHNPATIVIAPHVSKIFMRRLLVNPDNPMLKDFLRKNYPDIEVATWDQLNQDRWMMGLAPGESSHPAFAGFHLTQEQIEQAVYERAAKGLCAPFLKNGFNEFGRPQPGKLQKMTSAMLAPTVELRERFFK